jgi:hypothetical protein
MLPGGKGVEMQKLVMVFLVVGVAISIGMIGLTISNLRQAEPAAQPGSEVQGIYDLTFQAVQYEGFAGKKMNVALVDQSGNVVLTDKATVSPDGKIRISWNKVLLPDRSYHVDVFADMYDDGACAHVLVEPAWRVEIPAVTDNVYTELVNNGDLSGRACETFA